MLNLLYPLKYSSLFNLFCRVMKSFIKPRSSFLLFRTVPEINLLTRICFVNRSEKTAPGICFSFRKLRKYIICASWGFTSFTKYLLFPLVSSYVCLVSPRPILLNYQLSISLNSLLAWRSFLISSNSISTYDRLWISSCNLEVCTI